MEIRLKLSDNQLDAVITALEEKNDKKCFEVTPEWCDINLVEIINKFKRAIKEVKE